MYFFTFIKLINYLLFNCKKKTFVKKNKKLIFFTIQFFFYRKTKNINEFNYYNIF